MSRAKTFLQKINSLGSGGAILRAPESLFYLSAFSGGEGTIVITRDRLCLLVDSRYTLQAKAEAPEFEILPYDADIFDLLSSVNTVSYEGDFLSVSAFERLKQKIHGKTWVDVSETLLLLRKKKDMKELNAIANAVNLADKAFSHAVSRIKPGMHEYEVAALLEGYMRKELGALPAFDTVCASGCRSALPHGAASDKIIENGDFLTMDFGCLLDGYCSDITRTVVVGKAADWQKEIYNIVLYAQSLAENAAEGGMDCAKLDAISRDAIENFGYGEYFGHALGHGVGLAIHEYPTVSKRSTHKIETGDVFTIEPGIYLPDRGGVRIEDMLYATDGGHAVLTKSAKDFIEIR